MFIYVFYRYRFTCDNRNVLDEHYSFLYQDSFILFESIDILILTF